MARLLPRIDPLGMGRRFVEKRAIHEPVINKDVCGLNALEPADGHEPRVTGAGAHNEDLAIHDFALSGCGVVAISFPDSSADLGASVTREGAGSAVPEEHVSTREALAAEVSVITS